ncbi:tail fiber assembly protein [Gilliamella sp. ESL0254]|uniref:tail fiber assembly protein n=1 Tax=Gilliamella sp. ESL0254 TaxID=2705035 RepID=UPI0015808806|nr:tail fiber assembly protein [Gilliamella sp. ESL0254]NUF27007.1 tail fiber assembly protein [Gilliamella sp. ESL0254]
MKHFYSHTTQSFYIDEINHEIPVDSIEITAEQHDELYNAMKKGCVIFNDLTYSDPKPSPFHKWNEKTKKWFEDVNKRNQYFCEQNTVTKNTLINEANGKIAVLQDTIDLDMQEANEEEQLKQWKKYRILLMRVDINQSDINWPEKPNVT